MTIRGRNYKTYNYVLIDNNSESKEKHYYKTLKDITDIYKISRSNIYLLIRNPDVVRRKYNNLKIEKCNLHYLVVEHGIDASLIR
jgi:hypothetical protein